MRRMYPAKSQNVSTSVCATMSSGASRSFMPCTYPAARHVARLTLVRTELGVQDGVGQQDVAQQRQVGAVVGGKERQLAVRPPHILVCAQSLSARLALELGHGFVALEPSAFHRCP